MNPEDIPSTHVTEATIIIEAELDEREREAIAEEYDSVQELNEEIEDDAGEGLEEDLSGPETDVTVENLTSEFEDE